MDSGRRSKRKPSSAAKSGLGHRHRRAGVKAEQYNQRLVVILKYLGVIMHAEDVSIGAWEEVF
jgi:hemoglobin-like flavoprotein